MDVLRRPSEPENVPRVKLAGPPPVSPSKASDALPLPALYVTNAALFTLFFAVVYYLLSRWREKVRTSAPLHLVSPAEMAAIVAFVVSFVYLVVGFFGVDFVQSLFLRSAIDTWSDEEEVEAVVIKEESRRLPRPPATQMSPVFSVRRQSPR